MASWHHSTYNTQAVMSVVSSECLRNGGPDEKLELKNTWSRLPWYCLNCTNLWFFMKINLKNLNLGHSHENHWNCCHQTAYFEATVHQIWFWLGAPLRKTLVRLQARRWYGQQIGLRICLFTSGEDGHFCFNHPAACTLLCTVYCSCAVRCCSCKHEPFVISDF